MMRRSPATAYVLLTLTALFWAGSVITGRAVAEEVPPFALNFWRWLIAFALAAPFGVRGAWDNRAIVARHWRLLTMMAVFNMTAFGSLLFIAMRTTEAINGSLLIGSMPINIVLVSLVVLGIRITRRQVLGVALGFAGIAAIVCRGDPMVLVGLSFGAGDLLLWLGVIFYAMYSIHLPRVPDELELMPMMTVLFAIGCLACLPLYLWESLVQGSGMPASWTAAWSIGFMGIFPSLLAQVFWASAVARVGANTAGYFIYLAPVFGTVAAIVLLGETFAWFHALGIALIFAGIFLATRGAAPPRHGVTP
jgi:drug/metabolite transporter (DMT)-like permease